MRAPVILQSDWREPASILASLAHEDYSVGLISDGSVERGRWSYVAARPDEILSVDADEGLDPFSALSTLIGSGLGMGPAIDPNLPPFQGGVIGLASYELGARSEPVNLARSQGWPDLVCARYSSLLAFDHLHRKLFAIGCGSNGLEAADIALSWLTLPRPPVFQGRLAQGFKAAASNADYEANVATVVKKIEVGEIFQANIAQSWWGPDRAAYRNQSRTLCRLCEATRPGGGVQFSRAVYPNSGGHAAFGTDPADQGYLCKGRRPSG